MDTERDLESADVRNSSAACCSGGKAATGRLTELCKDYARHGRVWGL